MPKVTVILPVFNGYKYLDAAINSLLCQNFHDFELIIIDDGSTDESELIINKYNDSRIKFFQQENRGLAVTLNRAISLAKGKYIARQDQDDVSFPLRLKKQVAFLDENPDVAMVGTSAEIWFENEVTKRFHVHPVEDVLLRFSLLFDNYFVHSSIMIRRSVINAVGGYTEDKSRQPPEDYELWSRVMRTNKVANLPEVLVVYREIQGSMSRITKSPFLNNLVKISAENMAWAADCDVNTPEIVALSKLLHGDYQGVPNRVKYSKMKAILRKASFRIAKESGMTPQYMDVILKKWINRLRYRWIDYYSSGFIGVALNFSIKTYVRNIKRRMIKDAH